MILDDILQLRREQLRREQAEFGDTPKAAERAVAIAAERAAADTAPPSFTAALSRPGKIAIIAEIKKASPSKGIIAYSFEPFKIAEAYEQNGAAAISILTEEHYFQGSNTYLAQIKSKLPKLRKDFIIDSFQVYHARLLGASAVLLIAACLPLARMRELSRLAASLGMATLAEAHNEAELENCMECGAQVIGINNRDLTTFKVDLATTERLAPLIGEGFIKVSESGIWDYNDVLRVKAAGADAILVGEALMRQGEDITAGFKRLTHEN